MTADSGNATRSPYTSPQLSRYYPFPTLYAELRYPRIPQANQPAPPFRLLDLPGELRMLVYAAVLTLPFAIELWPETDDYIASHQLTTVDRNMQYLKAKIRQRGVNLGLLRVCKQIRHEATRCFYEENEWRFSGTNGWMVANAFLFTTRVFGWQNIRSITLPLPFQFSLQGQLNHGWGKVRPATSHRAIVRLANRIPFAIPPLWTYTGSVVDVCCALGKCESLRVANFVFPAWYDPGSVDDRAMQKLMEQVEKLGNTKSRGLKIRLVRVGKSELLEGSPTVLENMQRSFMHKYRERGWEVRQARSDKFGRFDIATD